MATPNSLIASLEQLIRLAEDHADFTTADLLKTRISQLRYEDLERQMQILKDGFKEAIHSLINQEVDDVEDESIRLRITKDDWTKIKALWVVVK